MNFPSQNIRNHDHADLHLLQTILEERGLHDEDIRAPFSIPTYIILFSARLRLTGDATLLGHFSVVCLNSIRCVFVHLSPTSST